MKFQFAGIDRRYLVAGAHLLVGAIFLNLPTLSSSHAPESGQEYLLRLAPPLTALLIFYTNYWFLVPRFIFPRKFVLFAVTNLMVYVVCFFILEENREKAVELGVLKQVRDLDAELIIRMFFSFVASTAVAVAVLISARWFKSESLRKDLQEEHLKSELLNLKNQLNPHFFFNTLNTIYGLIIQDQEKAQSAVHQLSKLMRYLLYDSNEERVPLKKEIDFMHHYIDLMRLRATDKMAISYEFPQVPIDLMVPPLLFISLIENGFKHGSSVDQPSFISIKVEVTDAREIHFQMENTDFAKSDTDRSGSGIGLQNVVKRLDLLYPNKHEFKFKSIDGIFESKIILKP
tara:strand:+ start:919 stop:1953 length:1035 start_codon:yes stop_codon:yes gene_type:complete